MHENKIKSYKNKLKINITKVKSYVESIRNDFVKPHMPIANWCLDYPSELNTEVDDSGSILVQGWVLLKPKMSHQLSNVRVICDLQPWFELCYPLNVKRQDVLNTIFPDDSGNKNQLMCGFRFFVPLTLTKLKLSLELNGERWLLKELNVQKHDSLSSNMKVLAGNSGWFFLDNDTNFSVDQHAGYIRLTDLGIAGWRNYVKAIVQDYNGLCSPVIFLIAPTKESVMHQYHPKKMAKHSILQPVFNLLPSDQLLYPVSELSKILGDNAFYKTDTHWTHQGAALASGLLAKRLGLPGNKVDEILIQDRYITREHTGDLGSKYNPKVTSPSLFLVSFSYTNYVVYDNGLPNFGRIIVTHYDDALEDTTCLIFGSSSSYSMLNYLCRFFEKLVFIHTAGNLDQTVVDSVLPNYLVAQTNARFMIRPPDSDYSLSNTITQKLASLDEIGLLHQSQNVKLTNMDLLKDIGLLPWHQHISIFNEK